MRQISKDADADAEGRFDPLGGRRKFFPYEFTTKPILCNDYVNMMQFTGF